MKDNIFIRYLPLLLLAIVWEVAPRLHIVDPSDSPPLSAVCAAWWSLLVGGDLWSNGVSSFINWFFGLGSAILVGIGLGVMMAWSSAVDDIAGPLVKALYPMPESALIPVMILWARPRRRLEDRLDHLDCLLPVILGLPTPTSAASIRR